MNIIKYIYVYIYICMLMCMSKLGANYYHPLYEHITKMNKKFMYKTIHM